MTNEEAKAYFKRHIDLYCVDGICREAEETAIKALEQQPSDTVSRGAFEQVMWERDVAIEQLKELGYELGQKIEHCDDAISRNAVIQTLNKMDRYTATELTLCDTNKKFPANEVFIVDDVYEQIAEQLPSVTHKPIECDDAINRPRVVKFEGTNMACMGGDEIMKEFENNPQQNNDKATCDDAISRQAVLDRIRESIETYHNQYTTDMLNMWGLFTQFIKEMPSVRPQEPIDAISREAVIEWLKAKDIIKLSSQEETARKELKALPPVTPQQKYGKWQVVSNGYGDSAYICECSECKDTVWVYKDADRKWNYCPNCGAKMRESEEV